MPKFLDDFDNMQPEERVKRFKVITSLDPPNSFMNAIKRKCVIAPSDDDIRDFTFPVCMRIVRGGITGNMLSGISNNLSKVVQSNAEVS